jgi:hypothetical protein
MQGECRIEFTADEAFPMIDELRNAKSYTPDGQLVASVVDGTGHAMLFYPNGVLHWEIHFISGNRTRLKHFNQDGSLNTEIGDPDGE